MKITFVTKFRLPQERGVSYGVVVMCKALVDAGATIELVNPVRKQSKAMFGKNIWNFHSIKKDLFTFKQLPCIELPNIFPLESIFSHLRFFVMSWSFSIITLVYLLINNIKIVHVFDDGKEILFLLRIVAFFYGPLIIFEMHLVPTDGYNRFLLEHSFPRIDGILSTTQIFADYCVKQGYPSRKIIIFPNGINIKDFSIDKSKRELRKELELPSKAFIVGYAGRFRTDNQEKGIPELIQSIKLVGKNIPSLFLVCIGGPDELVEFYVNQAKKASLSNNIYTIRGHVPIGKLYKYMKSFDICAMPFPWTHHYAYNMSPLKMFEYMMSDNPIIATDLPSIREILISGENSLLVKPNDVYKLAEAIIYLYKNQRIGNYLAKNAKKLVETKYTWQNRAKSELYYISKHSPNTT